MESWSNATFKNGCFGFFIGGRLIWSLRSTLGVDFSVLENRHCMKSSLENAALFYLPALDAYEELRMRAFPEMDSDAEDSDFDNLVSPESLLDDGYEVFLVESGKDAKLICGSNKGNSSDVFEFVLKCGEFQMVVREAAARWKAS
ncbi:immunity 42 family protein [Ralstonia pseudosolanacearum]|uniref:Imm42 family immunity protein n=1 Tax=Ralstonia pseudosolanacearum TaxID=1310165 RepID=UPI001E3FE936|nr:Imm42 family immunity protein [Ralstonia pseudosolanacearum]UYR09396.1 immunity 42 family protein [Ralstonia pseudosolanacearum]UYR13910.1 immunity 42 family protein [Ralstonia pseudosolanacearum]